MEFARLKPVTQCLLGFLGVLLCGCSGNLQDSVEQAVQREPEYVKSKTLPRLEVPPDLVLPEGGSQLEVPGEEDGTTYSEYARAEQRPATASLAPVLPENPKVHVKRAGDERWLVVQGVPSAVWPRAREFWLENGFLIETEDPKIGILETGWAENRADIPQGWIRSMLEKVSKSLYSALTRDKYRMRLEAGAESNTTEIYISHRGAEQVTQGETWVWQPRPSDPGLEAAMLSRMLTFLGTEKEIADRMVASAPSREERASVVRDPEGGTRLALQDDFSRAWRRTGLALDRAGFTVQDRDRSRGIYYVRYIDPVKDVRGDSSPGFFSKLKFWGDDETAADNNFLISLRQPLSAAEATTEVVVLDQDGNRDNGATAERILAVLHEQLK